MKNYCCRFARTVVTTGSLLAALSAPALAVAQAPGEPVAMAQQATRASAAVERPATPVMTAAVEVTPLPGRQIAVSPLWPPPVAAVETRAADEASVPGTGTMLLAALALMLWIAARRIGH
jgi:hypothetical protein